MGKVERISVEVPVEAAEALREAVASGEWASLDAAVADLVEDWQAGRGAMLAVPDDLLDRIVEDALASGVQDGQEAMAEIQGWLEDHVAGIEAAGQAGGQAKRRA